MEKFFIKRQVVRLQCRWALVRSTFTQILAESLNFREHITAILEPDNFQRPRILIRKGELKAQTSMKKLFRYCLSWNMTECKKRILTNRQHSRIFQRHYPMSEHNLHLKLSTWVTLKKGNGFAEEKISKLPAIIPSSTCGKVATLQSTATFREFRPQDRKSATVKKTGPVWPPFLWLKATRAQDHATQG